MRYRFSVNSAGKLGEFGMSISYLTARPGIETIKSVSAAMFL
jgi:hypothetical protein